MSADTLDGLLRSLRVRAGLSQNALARLAGVDPAYINRLERPTPPHRTMPSRRVVLAIAASVEAGRANTDRLLIAAGLCPSAMMSMPAWEPCLTELADTLADASLSEDDRAELRELLRIVAARWRQRPPSPDHGQHDASGEGQANARQPRPDVRQHVDRHGAAQRVGRHQPQQHPTANALG